MVHSQEEERKLFALAVQFLYSIFYKPIEEDYEFLGTNEKRLFTPKLRKDMETWTR